MSSRPPGGGIEAVSAAVLAMNRRLEVGEVLQTIVASARELLGAEYAALGVPDDHGGFAQFVVAGVSDEQWRSIGPLPRQHGILAAMLHEAVPRRLDDVRHFPSFAGWPHHHPVMKDFIGMPVMDGDDILGALFLANKQCPPGGQAQPSRSGEARSGEAGAGDTGLGPADEQRPATGGTHGRGAGADRAAGGKACREAGVRDRDAGGTSGAQAGAGHRGPSGPSHPHRPGGSRFTQEDEDLLRILADHAAIALTNARLYERSRELTLVEERARIAHELHDAVSQKLFSLRLTAQAATALLDADTGRARQQLGEVATLAAEAADELRAVVVELRPAALDDDGLVATLRTQAAVLNRAHSARVAFHAHAVRALPSSQEEAVLRVAQEAVHNALRHAGAAEVAVTLTGRGKGALLRVTDDGRGFDPESVRSAGRHFGLASMRDRATAVGGRLTVRSAPGAGTAVELEVPGG